MVLGWLGLIHFLTDSLPTIKRICLGGNGAASASRYCSHFFKKNDRRNSRQGSHHVVHTPL